MSNMELTFYYVADSYVVPMSYQKKLVRAMNQPIPEAWSPLLDVYDPSKLARVTQPD